MVQELITQLEGHYNRDIKGNVSPFRVEVLSKNNDKVVKDETNMKKILISKNNNIYKITDFAWYPNDFKRLHEYDYYNNIEIPYGKIPKQKGFIGTVKDAVVGQFWDTVNYGIDSVEQIGDSALNLIGMGKDPEKTYKNDFVKYLYSFPYMKVYEFKPDDMLGTNLKMMASALKVIDTMFSDESKDTSLKEMFSFIYIEIKDRLNKAGIINLDNKSDILDPKKRINGLVKKLYKNLIPGFYTGYYELPVLDYTGNLESKGSQGWNQGSLFGAFGALGESVKDFMGTTWGSSFDISTRPKWKIEGGGEGREGIDISMFLYNDTMQSVFANLSIIHSLIGGNMWYQDLLFQKSSSLYDIEIPGRFRYYFCTCDILVTNVGKVRKLTQDPYDKSKKNPLNELFNMDNIGKNNMEPNFNILNNIPDVYKVEFKFKSLLPNNFNTYYSYIAQGQNEDSIEVGQTVTSYSQKISDAIEAGINKANEANSFYDENTLSVKQNQNGVI